MTGTHAPAAADTRGRTRLPAALPRRIAAGGIQRRGLRLRHHAPGGLTRSSPHLRRSAGDPERHPSLSGELLPPLHHLAWAVPVVSPLWVARRALAGAERDGALRLPAEVRLHAALRPVDGPEPLRAASGRQLGGADPARPGAGDDDHLR